ncbi:hypothetical protein FHX81_4224 [Saccharothrix saharensis]|uniref:Uncharacterized protein n=1 Tax=Saccharothrix saharensis TaxID=571190 RepID=A0A543JG76_9PSEU|nr:hypothetical protein [Saccharothrix saharensis]TQM81840.1 hypothetical protein FHX81_4224 [Saccharothrix saharensis]
MITQVKHTVPSLDRVIIARQCTETLFPYLGCERGTATHQPHPPVSLTDPTDPTGHHRKPTHPITADPTPALTPATADGRR